MKAFFSLLLALMLVSTTAYSQLISGFLPKDCQGAARTAALKVAADAKFIGIATFKASVPVLTSTIDVGMDLTDGKSAAWAYLFYSPTKDTLLISPFVRLIGSCTAIDLPAGSLPGDAGIENLGKQELPTNYLQGTALLSALGNDGDYDTYHKAHPDSLPTLTVLSTSQDAFMDFPAGTPFWVLTWPGSDGITCFVHAESGQTICMLLPTSVQEDLAASSVAVAPNPVHDVMTVTLPLSWTGHTVTMDIVNAVGSVVASSTTPSATPMIIASTSTLDNGAYIIRLRSNGQVVQRSIVLVK